MFFFIWSNFFLSTWMLLWCSLVFFFFLFFIRVWLILSTKGLPCLQCMTFFVMDNLFLFLDATSFVFFIFCCLYMCHTKIWLKRRTDDEKDNRKTKWSKARKDLLWLVVVICSTNPFLFFSYLYLWITVSLLTDHSMQCWHPTWVIISSFRMSVPSPLTFDNGLVVYIGGSRFIEKDLKICIYFWG